MAEMRASTLDGGAVARWSEEIWERSIVPELTRYIANPCKSPAFDAEWQKHGYIEEAVAQIETWCRACPIPGLTVEVIRLAGRTPLLYMEVPARTPAAAADTVVLYGHLDKQPEMVGWREGLGPWAPVRAGDKLYGRGGGDDGYSAFAALAAIEALHKFGGIHARLAIIIEACEESGSYDLPAYIDALKDRIGTPTLVIALDSGAGNYDQLWSTTSLRGLVAATLKIDILTEGVHSGAASGIVPSTFRIARLLLDRIEDAKTGKVRLESAHVKIPPQRAAQAKRMASALKGEIEKSYPFVKGARPMAAKRADLILNRTWRPTLSVIGQAGMPAVENAGNVLRPSTTLVLSVRIPAGADPDAVAKELKATLMRKPPYGAKVAVAVGWGAKGWNAPPLAPWLEIATDAASRRYFGKPAMYMGEGGTIPFMAMLGDKFPKAQFLITGVLGPHSNAHGPNEFLHIPTAKKLTGAIADVLDAHARRER